MCVMRTFAMGIPLNMYINSMIKVAGYLDFKFL